MREHKLLSLQIQLLRYSIPFTAKTDSIVYLQVPAQSSLRQAHYAAIPLSRKWIHKMSHQHWHAVNGTAAPSDLGERNGFNSASSCIKASRSSSSSRCWSLGHSTVSRPLDSCFQLSPLSTHAWWDCSTHASLRIRWISSFCVLTQSSVCAPSECNELTGSVSCNDCSSAALQIVGVLQLSTSKTCPASSSLLCLGMSSSSRESFSGFFLEIGSEPKSECCSASSIEDSWPTFSRAVASSSGSSILRGDSPIRGDIGGVEEFVSIPAASITGVGGRFWNFINTLKPKPRSVRLICKIYYLKMWKSIPLSLDHVISSSGRFLVIHKSESYWDQRNELQSKKVLFSSLVLIPETAF